MNRTKFTVTLVACLVYTAGSLAQWAKTPAPETGTVFCLCVSKDGSIYATNTVHGVLKSIDNGSTWPAVNTGLPVDSVVTSLAIGETDIFAGTSGAGIFALPLNGTSWSEKNEGLGSPCVQTLAVSGMQIYAGCLASYPSIPAGAYYSTDNGKKWETLSGKIRSYCVDAYLINGTTLWAGISQIVGAYPEGCGVLRSKDGGTTWEETNTGGLGSTTISSILLTDSYLFTTTLQNGVYVSIDSGTSWKSAKTGLTGNGANAMELAGSGKTIFVATLGGIFRSDNYGVTWRNQGRRQRINLTL